MPCTFLLGVGHQGASNRVQNVEKWPFWSFLGVFDISKLSARVQLEQNLDEEYFGHILRCPVCFIRFWASGGK